MTNSGPRWTVERDYLARRCGCCDMWEVRVGNTVLRFRDEGLRELGRGLAQMRPPDETDHGGRSITVQLTSDASVLLVFEAEDFYAFRRLVDRAAQSIGNWAEETFDHPWSGIRHA